MKVSKCEFCGWECLIDVLFCSRECELDYWECLVMSWDEEQ